MAFGARPASIGRVRTCRGHPFLAAMDELLAPMGRKQIGIVGRKVDPYLRCGS